jgi:uncharacterized repeat protein (TIGR03803 family)
MSPTTWFSSATRTPAILLALVIFANNFSAAEWKEKVLYSFQGLPNDGAYPAGGVVFDQAGNLYGATTYGGANDCPGITQCGIVFQLQAPAQRGGAWSEHVLYVFKGVNSNDGDAPVGGVIFDQSGNLYGTTAYGGTGKCELFGGRVGCGTVYELVPPKQKGGAWTERVLHSFQSGKDGYFPWGNLTFDSGGNLYGATQYGGGYGSCNAPYYQFCGTVFKLSPPKTKDGKWTEQVLYAFKSGSDGANPNGGLVFDNKGRIYGTTYFGGNESGECNGGVGGTGCGTVFALDPPMRKGSTWTEKVIHRFDGLDGGSPAGGVVFGRNGDLYCTTLGGGGGNFPSGAVIQLESHSDRTWTEQMLHSFQDNSDGGEPRSTLVFDAEGDLYGTATGGGPVGGGTIFRLRPTGDSWSFTAPYDFTGAPDGSYPFGNLIFDEAGSLYGTTQYGGSGQTCGRNGCGTVFMVRPRAPGSRPRLNVHSHESVFGR